MIKFKEYLKEMSIAGYGDWTPSKEIVGDLSLIALEKYWERIAVIQVTSDYYEVYKLDNIYIAGNVVQSDETNRFEIDFEIKLTEHKSIAHDFKIKQKLMNVDGVKVKKSTRGRGLAKSIYKLLVKQEEFIILGDEVQYFGARKLWSRLSKDTSVKVDIIDVETKQYLEKDVILKHGTKDWEFDDRVWSYEHEKKNIRLLLKDILS